MTMTQIDGDTEIQEIEHLESKEKFIDAIKLDKLSVVRVGIGNNIKVSDVTEGFIQEYSDKINFYTIDFHSISEALPEYHKPGALNDFKPPFTVFYWDGHRLGPIVFGPISENNSRVKHILDINS